MRREPDPLRYESFNAFFTRALRAGARPARCRTRRRIVCPGRRHGQQRGAHRRRDCLLQAKGRDYTLEALLAGDAQLGAALRAAARSRRIYLAPFNYHRIHMPLAGTLRAAWYVPGACSASTTPPRRSVPGLFARNERVVLRLRDGAAARSRWCWSARCSSAA